MAKKTVKLNLSELATIKWLLEAPEKRFIVFTNHAPALYERLPPNPAGLHPIRTIRAAHRSEPPEPELEAFGGKLNISAGSFRDLDFARMYGRARTAYPPKNMTTFEDKVSDVYTSGAWHYSCIYVDIDPKAAAVYWETTGKKAYEKLLAAYTSQKAEGKIH